MDLGVEIEIEIEKSDLKKETNSQPIDNEDNYSQISQMDALPVKNPTNPTFSKQNSDASFDFGKTYIDNKESDISLAPQESSKSID